MLQHFLPYGEVIECKVIMDKVTGLSKGYAFVEYATVQEAEAAAGPKTIDGKVCECKISAPTEPKSGVNNEANVFVGGLLPTTTTETLQTAMEAYGPVKSAKIIVDKETGKSKGFGFVEFAQAASGQRAVRTGFVMVDGKNCNCRLGSKSDGHGNMYPGLVPMVPMMLQPPLSRPPQPYKDMNDPLTYAKEQLLSSINQAQSLHGLFTSTRSILDQLHTYYYNQQQQSGADAANATGKRPGLGGPLDMGPGGHKRPKFDNFGGGAGYGAFNNTAPNWNQGNYY